MSTTLGGVLESYISTQTQGFCSHIAGTSKGERGRNQLPVILDEEKSRESYVPIQTHEYQ